MRLFLAIPLTAEIRANLRAMQTRLQRAGAEVRWVEPANFHLTVKFIGDQADARVSEIETVCAEAAGAIAAFDLCIQGAGAFPKRGPLKTIWAGVSEGADAWKELVGCVEKPLLAFGVAREGGLVPHITLGRVKSETDALRAAIAAEAGTDCDRQRANKIVLIQSVLDPGGAAYTPVREWPLIESSTSVD